MDIFDEEILKFWAALQNQEVRYIMVGGYATNLHGFQRYTGDIDIWIEDTLENRKRLRKAFVESGMEDYYMLETMQFIPGWTEFNLVNGLRLDIMVSMKGLEGHSFEECLDMASVADIDGVKVSCWMANNYSSNISITLVTTANGTNGIMPASGWSLNRIWDHG